MTMKKIFTLIVFACVAVAFAVEYNLSIIGNKTDSASGKNINAPFDGNEKTYLGWTDKETAEKGFTVNFYQLRKVNKITLLTDKNIQNLNASVERWEADRFRWKAVEGAWQRSEHNGKSLFTFEDKNGFETYAVRILSKDAKFRIYESVFCVIDRNGKNIVLTEVVRENAKSSSVDIVPNPATDFVSGNLRMTLWSPGGVGKKKKAFFVGRLNSSNRNDRVIMRLDCTQFIEKGSVSKAELYFNAQPATQNKAARIFLLEYLPAANSELIKNDLSQSKTDAVAYFVVEDYKSPSTFKVDLTKVVNDALEQGNAILKFRFRDLEAENSRNIYKKASAISVNKVKLNVVL